MGDFSKTINLKNKNKKIKSCFAPLCVSLGLKKPRDFTMSEGHGYPLVFKVFVVCFPKYNSNKPHHSKPTKDLMTKDP
jgi:hypothetical protein